MYLLIRRKKTEISSNSKGPHWGLLLFYTPCANVQKFRINPNKSVDYSILFFAFLAYLLCELCGETFNRKGRKGFAKGAISHFSIIPFLSYF
jgi:hypothetical protein